MPQFPSNLSLGRKISLALLFVTVAFLIAEQQFLQNGYLLWAERLHWGVVGFGCVLCVVFFAVLWRERVAKEK